MNQCTLFTNSTKETIAPLLKFLANLKLNQTCYLIKYTIMKAIQIHNTATEIYTFKIEHLIKKMIKNYCSYNYDIFDCL